MTNQTQSYFPALLSNAINSMTNYNNGNKRFGAGKPLNKNTFFCIVCNIDLQSQVCLDQHLVGKAHKKKLDLAQKMANTPVQQIKLSISANNAPISNPHLQKTPITNTQSIQEPIASTDVKPTFNAPKLEAKNEPMKIQNSPQIKPVVVPPATANTASPVAVNPLIASLSTQKQDLSSLNDILTKCGPNVTRKEFIRIVDKGIRCELCEILCPAKDQFLNHLTGKKHKNKWSQFCAVEAARMNSTLVVDTVTNTSANNNTNNNLNENALKLPIKTAENQPFPKPLMEIKTIPVQAVPPKTETKTPQKSATSKPVLPPPPPLVPKEVPTCAICDLKFKNDDQLNIHQSGKKHFKKLKSLSIVARASGMTEKEREEGLNFCKY
jgi:hypothetical protein